MNLERIVEAVLFSSSRPLSVKNLAKRMENFSIDEIHNAINRLIQEYNTNDSSLEILEVAGGFQMRTRPAYREWVRRFAREKDAGLTRAMLEALAVIAYKQPVTKRDIDTMRGVDSARVLKQLLERKLIEIGGREEELGQKILFRTTGRFLELYGLKDIRHMPTFRELESLASG